MALHLPAPKQRLDPALPSPPQNSKRARRSGQLPELSPRALEIKGQIESGEYDVASKLDKAIENFLLTLSGPFQGPDSE